MVYEPNRYNEWTGEESPLEKRMDDEKEPNAVVARGFSKGKPDGSRVS
jgi:hypothetical protein